MPEVRLFLFYNTYNGCNNKAFGKPYKMVWIKEESIIFNKERNGYSSIQHKAGKEKDQAKVHTLFYACLYLWLFEINQYRNKNCYREQDVMNNTGVCSSYSKAKHKDAHFKEYQYP